MKHVFKRIISVVVILCLMLPITAHAAVSPAADDSGNETKSINTVSAGNTGKVMMLKLNETQAYLNGNMIPTLVYDSGYVSKLIMVNGSSLLPLRFVCQCLGFEVGYDAATGRSTITDTENSVRFEVVTGTKEMYKYDLDGNLLASGTATAPTTIIEGVTHVPVRSLLEAMGFRVYWDDEGYVLISKNPMTAEEFQSLIDSWGQSDEQPPPIDYYPADLYTIECSIKNSWENNQSVEVKITNTGDTSILNWALSIDTTNQISDLWNAAVYYQGTNNYILKNAGHNYEIQPNQSVTFGYVRTGHDLSSEDKFNLVSKRVTTKQGFETNFIVTEDHGTGFQANLILKNNTEKPIEAWMLSFDSNFSITNIWDGRIIENSLNNYTVGSLSWTIPIPANSSITLGITGTKSSNVQAAIENLKLSEIVIINWQDATDSDNDGLPDVYETYAYGTDPNNPDTDGDLLPDGYEINTLLTNPLLKDTNRNGTSDANEDFDSDGLMNYEEFLLGTDPYEEDSDYDGLSDYDEVNLYSTDPLLADTDNDKMSDGIEIEYGTDPTNPDTNGNGVLDGDEIYTVTKVYEGGTVKPTVVVELYGYQLDSLNITPVDDDNVFLNNQIPGYIGTAYDLNVDGEIQSAALTFEFDANLLNQENFHPAIYYFDEESQFLVKLENQSITGNKVTVPLGHFSKYLVLNEYEYSQVWDYDFLFDETAQERDLDIVFVTDISNSMEDNDPAGVRKDVTKNFINALGENDRVALITFTRYAYIKASLTTDKALVMSAVDDIVNDNGFTTYSGTDCSAATREALNLLASDDRGAKKIIIFLTDGADTHTIYNYAALGDEAKESNVMICTIGLGSSITDHQKLQTLADVTGGKYFAVNEAGDLYDEFAGMQTDIDDFYRDTDDDGINDYYEKQIGAGYLRTGTGITLVGLDYQNPDTDGDGIPDGQEIFVADIWGKTYVIMTSNPILTDSDGDYYPDNNDNDKLNANPMYINDKGIDDSDFHNGSTITEKTPSSYTDGRFVANQNNHTAKYVFDRSTYKYHRFSLTPEKSACYRFSGASDLEVTYEKGLLFKKTVTVNPEPDGTYILEIGTTYTINMKTTASGEFSVEQDNWVYAPNGGKWTPTKYSNLNASVNYMRQGSLYIPTSRFISAVSKLNDDMVTLDLDPNGDIDKQLDKLFTNTGMLVEQEEIDSARNAILAAAGTTTISIILIVFPEPSSTAVGTQKLARIVVQIITALSDVATYSGTPSAISTFMAYAEQYSFSRAFREGDRNVFTTKYNTSYGRTWNPWTSTPYINKFSLGDRGTVDKNITDQNIIDWCGWKVLEAAE